MCRHTNYCFPMDCFFWHWFSCCCWTHALYIKDGKEPLCIWSCMLTVRIYNRNVFFTLGGGKRLQNCKCIYAPENLACKWSKFWPDPCISTYGKQTGNCLLKAQSTHNGKKFFISNRQVSFWKINEWGKIKLCKISMGFPTLQLCAITSYSISLKCCF